jgi:hypothetical protein
MAHDKHHGFIFQLRRWRGRCSYVLNVVVSSHMKLGDAMIERMESFHIRDHRLRQAVLALIEARELETHPSVAALGMADNDEIGPRQTPPFRDSAQIPLERNARPVRQI